MGKLIKTPIIHLSRRGKIMITRCRWLSFSRRGVAEGRLGLFLRYAEHAEELVTGPVASNYPNCAMTAAEGLAAPPPGWRTWFSELELTPELFPILRHAQFEDMINRTFADPITAILRAMT